MQLLFDSRDIAYHQKVGSQIPRWLDDLGGVPLEQAKHGLAFLFTGARPIEDYRDLVADLPLVRDRPHEREPLLHLDTVLNVLEKKVVQVPMPRTWRIPLDAPVPDDIDFPLFVRTAGSSWKKGGEISRVRNQKELEDEAFVLRRALGWDATILARQWLDLEPAGEGHYGPVAQEIRIWVVDGIPYAWSFHYMQIVSSPTGFPLAASDVTILREQATTVGAAFQSRLVAADFAKGRDGTWWFIEAGPGSCAGTNHEAVFKAVARALRGEPVDLLADCVGGLM